MRERKTYSCNGQCNHPKLKSRIIKESGIQFVGELLMSTGEAIDPIAVTTRKGASYFGVEDSKIEERE